MLNTHFIQKGTKTMHILIKIILVTFSTLLFIACRDSDVASKNLSKKADMFEIDRRVVFYNGITDNYILSIRGKCSIKKDKKDVQLEVTCKIGDEKYKKHFLGISDNVTYFVEQMDAVKTNVYHYEVVFKPQTILPDVDFRGSFDKMNTLKPDNKD